MNRRAYLTTGTCSTALLLSGCLGVSGGSGANGQENDQDSQDGSNCGNEQGQVSYSVTPLSLSDDSKDMPVEYDISILSGGYSDPESPLMVNVRLENISGKLIEYHDRRFGVFSGIPSSDRSIGLYPDWTEESDFPFEFDSGCWRRTEKYIVKLGTLSGKLYPRESRNRTLALAQPYNQNCCLETTSFEKHFRTRIWAGTEKKELKRYRYGFVLERKADR